MKIETTVKTFREAFGVASRAVPSRTPKPILLSVKLVASDSGAELSATDLELGIRHPIPGVRVVEPGTCLLPREVTDKILRSADDDMLTIETDGQLVNVRCGRAKWKVATEDATLFPEVPGFREPGHLTVSAPDLLTLVKRTHYATDQLTTKYALGGMLVEVEGGRCRFVATDGRRLSVQVVPCDGADSVRTVQRIIPVRFCQMLTHAAKDAAIAEFSFDAYSVVARVGGTTVYSRLVEGRFPAWGMFLDQEGDVAIPGIEPESFLRALEQAAATTSEDSRGVDFAFADGVLTMTSRSSDSGSSEVEFAVSHAGRAVELTMDPRYLIDAFKSVGPDPVTLKIRDHNTQLVARTGSGFTCVAMPLTRDR